MILSWSQPPGIPIPKLAVPDDLVSSLKGEPHGFLRFFYLQFVKPEIRRVCRSQNFDYAAGFLTYQWK
jgi:hypothetical protein